MNVACALLTTESVEPHFQESFIAGYESAGGTWSGNLTVLENIDEAGLVDLVDSLAYDFVMHNYTVINIINNASYVATLQSAYDNGSYLISPAGSNSYGVYSYYRQLYSPVICGNGETANIGGYNCEFFDEDPFRKELTISTIYQQGSYLVITFSATESLLANTTGVVLSDDITGFTNNPSGNYGYSYLNAKRIAISFNGGGGAYVSGGTAHLHFQSYTTPFIAGKFAYAMDVTGATMDEIRTAFRLTADYQGVTNSGYGKINLSNAIAYLTGDSAAEIDLTPGTITATKTSDTNINIAMDIINGAEQYKLYRNDTLIDTLEAGEVFGGYDYTISGRSTPSNRYRFRYRGISGDTSGDWSNTAIVPYMQSKFIRTRT